MAATDPTLTIARPVSAPGRLARWVPGIFFLSYLVGTVLLYFFGPWRYPMDQGQDRLVLFLAAVHLALALGYALGTRGQPRPSTWRVSVNRLVLAAAVVELALLWPTSYLYTGSWIPRLGPAFQDLGAVYSDALLRRETGTPIVNYVRILMSPLLAAALPLAVFSWHRLSALTRILFAGSVIGTIALFLAMGANAGIAHWMVLFPWFVLAGHLSGTQRLSRRTWITAGIVAVASVALFAVVFAGAMSQRSGSFAWRGMLPGIDAVDPSAPGHGAAPQMVPSDRFSASVGMHGLAAYLTHGYYAVYLSLQEPFVPTYGVGNSVFLHRQVARVMGEDILARTYPRRIEARGWNAYGYWATIYPWLASDITFPGVVLLMVVVGFVLARVWLDTLGGANSIAVVFLAQLLLMLYYFPAHNKVMHSGEGVMAFWVWAGLWWFMRGRPDEG